MTAPTSPLDSSIYYNPDFSAAFGLPKIDPTAFLKAYPGRASKADYSAAFNKAGSKSGEYEVLPAPTVDTGTFRQPVSPEDYSYYQRAMFDRDMYTGMLKDAYKLANEQSVSSTQAMLPYQITAGELGRRLNLAASQDWRTFTEGLPSAQSARATEQQARKDSADQAAAALAYATAAQQNAANNFGILGMRG